jgi:hypothetical protein
MPDRHVAEVGNVVKNDQCGDDPRSDLYPLVAQPHQDAAPARPYRRTMVMITTVLRRRAWPPPFFEGKGGSGRPL